MAYDTLKGLIRQYIKTNGQNEITGQILQNVLIAMVDEYPSLTRQHLNFRHKRKCKSTPVSVPIYRASHKRCFLFWNRRESNQLNAGVRWTVAHARRAGHASLIYSTTVSLYAQKSTPCGVLFVIVGGGNRTNHCLLTCTISIRSCFIIHRKDFRDKPPQYPAD